jgi:lipid-A-disaccharide synthase
VKLGLLAGEASGDILGASLVRELRQRHPDLSLSGIGGPLLIEEGLASLYPMDRLAVMGLVEPFKRLPELLRIRADVFQQQSEWRPNCFIGIDSPDFNLTLERRLRQQGQTCAHLVSPSVWAWRPNRIKTIAQSVDLMLCLLPFELDIYQRAGIPAVCVGHPLIEELADLPDKNAARVQLGLPSTTPVLAVLPGSRAGEVATLMNVFVSTLERLTAEQPQLTFVIPAANGDRRNQIEKALENKRLNVTIVDGQGRLAMQAADAVLLASGTATLEAMLLRRPMVIAYRMAWLSWQILSRMATTRFIGLPNILAGREVVPELLQDAATPEALADALIEAMTRGEDIQVPAFDSIAASIGSGFAGRCADALEHLIQKGRQ